MVKRKITSFGYTTETVEIGGLDNLSYENFDKLVGYLSSFCIDFRGKVRKGAGMVAVKGSDYEFNLDYVPPCRYDIEVNTDYPYMALVLNLPNPNEEPENYKLIRNNFITEINKRLLADLRKVI